MGTWYETCGITELPILHGEEALLVPLIQTHPLESRFGTSGGFCYPIDTWMPLMLPVRGVYSEFIGTIDLPVPPVSWALTESILNEYALTWVDDRHDSEKTEPLKAAWDPEFFQNLERGVVQAKDCSGNVVSVGQTLIRADVWDHLLAMSDDEYWGGAHGTAEALRKDAERLLGLFVEAQPGKFGLIDEFAIERTFGRGTFRSTVFSPYEAGFGIGRILGRIVRGLKYDKTLERTGALEVLKEIADVAHVNHLMSNLRRHWGPRSGKGSSHTEWKNHASLARFVAAVAEKKLREADE